MSNHTTYSMEVDSGEFIAALEVVCIAGSPDTWDTPGEADSWEIESGEVRFFDEEGEKLLPEVHGLDKLTPKDMQFINQEIDRQLANIQADAEDYYMDYGPEDRLHPF